MTNRSLLSRHLSVSLVLCASALVACGGSSDSTGDGGFTQNGGSSGSSGSGGSSGSSGASGSTAGDAGSSGSSIGGAGGSDSVGGSSGTGGAGGLGGGGAGGSAGSAGSAGSSAGTAGTAGTAGSSGTAGTAGAGTGGAGGDSSFGGAAQGVGGSSAGTAGTGGTGAGGTAPQCLEGLASTDDDGDGWTEQDGDCRDCDAAVHPGAVDAPNYVVCMPGDAGCVCDANNMNCKAPAPVDLQIDESCGHTAPASCGAAYAIGDTDPMHAADAIDICAHDSPNYYGLVAARYVRSGADVNNLPTLNPGAEVGITSLFGSSVGPQIGQNMLVLSSGHARDADDPGACGSLTCSNHASGTPVSGYPQPKSGCTISNVINDDVGFEVTLRAPINATGFRFRFRFYSFEYPEWVCTTFNDQFAAIVTPQPAGSLNGNISFDSTGAPVSVNNALFDVTSGPDLAGTGFDVWNNAGATSWLYSQAPIPVAGGQTFKLVFMIWDTGDSAWDSTVLIDAFEWIADGTTVQTGTGKVDP